MGSRGVVLLLALGLVGCRSTTPLARLADSGPSSAGDAIRFEAVEGEAVGLPPPQPLERQGPLTLEELERLAFGHNPTLVTAWARIRAARGKRLQAGLYPNPVVGYHATEIGNLGTAGQQGGFVSQRFITGGKRRLDRAVAGKGVEEAHALLRAQELRVLNDVRLRFYEALVAQRRVELSEELAKVGADVVAASRKLLEGRLGTENDLLQARIRSDEASILRDNARNNALEAWRRLAVVVGLPNLEPGRLEGPLDADWPSFEWEECSSSLLAQHPELRAAQARVERAGLAVERAEREPIPNVDLSVSVRHHNVTGSDVVNVQAGIPIPIFDDNRGNIRAALADLVAAKKDAERIELELRDRLAVAVRRYSNARHQVERYGGRIVPNAKKSLDLVTNGYDKGQVEYLTVLTAQQTYVQVSLSRLDSLLELWRAATLLEGGLSTGSLSAGRG